MKTLGNQFWQLDFKLKNARGKKCSWSKAKIKRANRSFRHKNKVVSLNNE